jgi:hypothetical protein
MAVTKQTEGGDAHEARGQDMQQEAADELGSIERHDPLLGVVAIILPAERDVPLFECEQAMMGDGDLMRVTAEMLQHLGGTAEGGFGRDDPLGVTTACEPLGEGVRISGNAEQGVRSRPEQEVVHNLLAL